MDTKAQILKRLLVVLLILIGVSILIVVKLVKIQFVDGVYWKEYAQKSHLILRPIESERGTIMAENGSILSASLPFYDIYIDFGVSMMREHKGKIFKQKIDSLTTSFATLWQDKTPLAYKDELLTAYHQKHRFYLFKKRVSYQDVQKIKRFAYLNMSQNKYSSGFIFEAKNKRIYPYGQLANRVIGFLRDSATWNLGLEKAYDSVLRGAQGYRLMKYIAAGSYAPLQGYDVMPQNGKDIVTTLDMNIQDIAAQALEEKLRTQKADWGTCIVMEVSTGKIRALVNLKENEQDSSYVENVNYALKRYEPGSTFKIVSMLALLDDGFVDIHQKVDLHKGQLEYTNGVFMYDSEKHNLNQVSLKTAFAMSSNVGISRTVNKFYHTHPDDFLRHIRRISLHRQTGFDLVSEEASPFIPTPQTKYWSSVTSLPWLSIGYGVEITPLQTLMLYNAIANNGVMMKPYLVSQIIDQGLILKQINPKVWKESICKPTTLRYLQELLRQVVDSGTARKVFMNAYYKVAGKTGTNLFYEKGRGYRDSAYLSSFVGYFPVAKPLYSCIVIIKNKPKTTHYYGASVAAPVFRAIADKLMAMPLYEATQQDERTYTQTHSDQQAISTRPPIHYFVQTKFEKNSMPNLVGMNLRAAIACVEALGIRVEVAGDGVVVSQSIEPGTLVRAGQVLKITLAG